MSRNQKAKPLTVEVLPPEESGLAPEFAVRLENAYLDALSGIQKILTFGILSRIAKQSLKHGQYKNWIASACPLITYRTAARFNQLTDAILEGTDLKGVRLDTFGIDPEKLFTCPRKSLSKEAGKFRDTLQEVIENKSRHQLELDFGIRKPRKGKLAGKGETNNPEGKNGWSGLKDPFKCAEGAWAYFYGTEDEAVIRDEAFLGSVRFARRHGAYKHLPVHARHKAVQELKGLINDIESTYQETLEVAKKAKKAASRKK